MTLGGSASGGRFKSGSFVKAAQSIAAVPARSISQDSTPSPDGLKQQIWFSAVAGVVLALCPVGFLQIGWRSPLIPLASSTLALIAVEQGNKASKQLGSASELSSLKSHLEQEKAKERLVGTYFPDSLPLAIPTDVMGRSCIIAMINQGVRADLLATIEGPTFYRLKVTPRGDTTEHQMLALAVPLQTSLSSPQPPIISPQKGYWAIDIARSDRQFLPIEKYLTSGFLGFESPVTIPIGVNIDGQLVTAKLSDPNTCHFIVAGTTGSGKSEYLRALFRWLTQWKPECVQVVIIDPKRVTFPEMGMARKLKAITDAIAKSGLDIDLEQIFPEGIQEGVYDPWLPVGVIKDEKPAIAATEHLVQEMRDRYLLLEEYGCQNLEEFNRLARKIGLNPLPVLVMIFDEYFMFMANRLFKEELESKFKDLGAAARAAGIALIVATQRPDATVITPLIRSNLPGRVCLRVASEADGQIVLSGEAGTVARYLLGKGDLFADLGYGPERMQALYWDGKSLPTDPGAIDVKSQAVSEPKQAIGTVKPKVGLPSKLQIAVESKQPAPTVEVAPQAKSEEPFDPLFQAYKEYRYHRENGGSPNKFFELAIGKHYEKKQKDEFYEAIDQHIRAWIVELSAVYLPEQIPSVIWNVKVDSVRFQEEYQQRLQQVNEVLSSEANH
jgi:hypothetical protein